MKIKIKVKPNSPKSEIIKEGEEYIAHLKSSPVDNKANVELLKLSKKFFNADAKIKSGFTSKIKIIEVKDANKI